MLGYPDQFWIQGNDTPSPGVYSSLLPMPLPGGTVALFAINLPQNYTAGDVCSVLVALSGDGLDWSNASPVTLGPITNPTAIVVTYVDGEFMVTDGVTAYIGRNVLDGGGWTSIPVQS